MGALPRAPSGLRGEIRLHAERSVEGARVRGEVALDWEGEAELDVVISGWRGVVPVDPAPTLGWSLPNGRGPVTLPFTVLSRSWGVHDLGALWVRVRRAGSLAVTEHRLAAGPTPARAAHGPPPQPAAQARRAQGRGRHAPLPLPGARHRLRRAPPLPSRRPPARPLLGDLRPPRHPLGHRPPSRSGPAPCSCCSTPCSAGRRTAWRRWPARPAPPGPWRPPTSARRTGSGSWPGAAPPRGCRPAAAVGPATCSWTSSSRWAAPPKTSRIGGSREAGCPGARRRPGRGRHQPAFADVRGRPAPLPPGRPRHRRRSSSTRVTCSRRREPAPTRRPADSGSRSAKRSSTRWNAAVCPPRWSPSRTASVPRCLTLRRRMNNLLHPTRVGALSR